MIVVTCGQCQSRIKAKPEYAGKKVKCPKCKTPVTIPSVEADTPSPAVSENQPVESEAPSPLPPPVDAVPQPPVVDTVSQQPAISPPPSSDDAPAVVPEFPTFDSPPEAQTFVPQVDAGGDVVLPADSGSAESYARKKSGGGAGVIVLGSVLFFGLLGAGVWWLGYFEGEPELVVRAVDDQTVQEEESLQLSISVENRDQHKRVRFRLVNGPTAAIVDKSGKFFWTPTEKQGPGDFDVKVEVVAGDQSKEVAFSIAVAEVNQSPVLKLISDVEVAPGQTARFQTQAKDSDLPAADLRYELAGDSPDGAKLDPATGAFTWETTEADAGSKTLLTVVAREVGDEGLACETTVSVTVTELTDPYRLLLATLRKERDIEERSASKALPFTGVGHLLRFNDEEVHVFVYGTPFELADDVKRISTSDTTLFEKQWVNERPLTVYREGRILLASIGGSDATLELLSKATAPSIAVLTRKEAPKPVAPQRSELVVAFEELYEKRDNAAKKKRMLFSPRNYDVVRKVFSERFEKEHADDIQNGFGDDHDAMMEWLNERTDFKEELFTAFKPEFDNVEAGLGLIKEIKDKFPKRIDRYGSLAIAIAVTWDRENRNRGIYDYGNHQRRTHSVMPDDLIGALDNFEYLIETESSMQGRVQFMPWEFLTLLVNHKTPLRDRGWALSNYLPRRAMFGSCYKDCPYDYEMLKTSSRTCKLDGKEYNLPNIQQFGGVCAMQADYAARIGKSLGVPAAYVTGASRSGDLHAWVMWVELKGINARSIQFSLESYGRYRGDNFYVGHLHDPQTGQKITDRILELRLHQVGTDALKKRHADRMMTLYPEFIAEMRMDFDQKSDFLSQTLALNPWNEQAWAAVTKISDGEELDRLRDKQMNTILSQLFQTFARFPDFTLTVFEDLIQFDDDMGNQIKAWYRLLDVYSASKRPDLAFNALIRLSEILVENERSDEAIQALATAVQRYPDEGNYVPKMLDRLEQLASKIDGGDAAIVQFYSVFLPKIPQKRGNSPSEYCIAMYQRGISLFQSAGQTQLAQQYSAALTTLQASGQ
ncbi:MAG: hypothetical protein ACKVII_18670 [Planctomycetales bacterium]